MVLSLLPVPVSLKVGPDTERPWIRLGLLSLLFLTSALEQISQVHNGGIMNVSVTLNTSSLRASQCQQHNNFKNKPLPPHPSLLSMAFNSVHWLH